ncbi:3-oxoacyl-[acyl-carrier-protein] reductase [Anaerofustis stercorihominis]|uniref:3-oxoacyl-[acyl-carrier-protein] reductase n=1 Tax=Anaerofustis stercorihominis TaxID=214853 RepID=UPI001A9B296F|nr:3-oxoacyl-[acyl-carrier-protein] reductase [Anaerofustis stercorihominis]
MMERKTAVVTGASRGIGKAIALALAKEGFNVVVNYNGNKEKAEQVKKECEDFGVNAITVKANVADFSESENLIKEAVSTFGSIDVLVNNSGITKDTLLLRMKEEDFDSVIDVNLKGTFNTIKHAARQMMKQRSGSIINMSSVVGISGNAGQINYAASKAGVIGLTKSVARELASRGIRANAVAPGFIETDMTDELNDKAKEEILKTIPLNDTGKSEDVANLVVFLASEKSRYITGQVIHVDGGMLM